MTKHLTIKVVALFSIISLLAACARGVKIVKPGDQSTQYEPVAFEVTFHSGADPSTFDAQLNSSTFSQAANITSFFTTTGNRATASSNSTGFPTLDCATSYTFRASAHIQQPQPWQARVDHDEVRFTFLPPLPLSLSLSISMLTAQPGLDEGDVPGQIFWAAATVSIPQPLPNALSVTLIRSHPFIVLSYLQVPNIASVIIPAGTTSANHTPIWANAAGTGTITARAECYQDATVSVQAQ